MRELWLVPLALALSPELTLIPLSDPEARLDCLCSDSFFFGVFAALRDPTAFAQVHCEHGQVEWPGDLDLVPDAM